MAMGYENFGFWAEYNGRIVTIDGLQHRIVCRTYKTRYPSEREVIDVSAEPVSKSSKHYREEKAKLGDDWSIDVLASDIDLQCEILQQLQAETQPAS